MGACLLITTVAWGAQNATNSTDDTSARIPSTADTNAIALSAEDTTAPSFSNLEAGARARPASRQDLQSFRLIWERNIFDAGRSGRYTRTRAPRREPERGARSESFALVGTMSYEKGRFAFFEGSSSEYQKVLETGGTIAGYKIAELAPTHVKLESTNGSAIELPVGMQMKKMDEGEWAVTARAESPQGSARPAGSSGASAGESSEVLKRLMGRREQEGSAETTNTSDALPTGQERSEKAEQPEKTGPTSSGAADEVLRKLLQKREQEFNK